VCEEVARYEARGLGAAVAVVDADEGGGSARLDLAVVLQHLVGLSDGKRELTRRVAPKVPRPEQVVGDTAIVAAVLILPRTRAPPDRAQARGRSLRQPGPHPSFPSCRLLVLFQTPPPEPHNRTEMGVRHEIAPLSSLSSGPEHTRIKEFDL
jgi:hypothetical protein